MKKLTFTKGNHPENIKKKLQKGGGGGCVLYFGFRVQFFISNVSNKNRRDVLIKEKKPIQNSNWHEAISFLRNYVKKKAEKEKEEPLQACIEKENRTEKNNDKSNQPGKQSKSARKAYFSLIIFFSCFNTVIQYNFD